MVQMSIDQKNRKFPCIFHNHRLQIQEGFAEGYFRMFLLVCNITILSASKF